MKRARTAVVVDDDHDQGDAISVQLELAGFDVRVARTGGEGLALVRQHEPDLVTLDMSLPDLDGVEVCRRIREFTDCYVIVVSARNSELDRIVGLNVGADDYLVKPFSMGELHARVEALGRRPRASALRAEDAGSSHDMAAIGCKHILLDPRARVARAAGTEIPLTRIEFDLLAYLVRRPRSVVSREELLRFVWATEFIPHNTHVVDVHLANVRRKLRAVSADNTWIHTVRAVGFRFDDPCFD